jgi:hypothetical protein
LGFGQMPAQGCFLGAQGVDEGLVHGRLSKARGAE